MTTTAPDPAPLAVVYCTDEDIAIRAPQDFVALCPKWQRLAFGADGGLDPGGWVLSSATVDFEANGVAPGHVVALAKPGAFSPEGDLFAVDSVAGKSATLRRLGRPGGGGQPPAAAGAAGVKFEVRTYGPQIDNASYDANKFFGIDPNLASKAPDKLYEPRELRQFVALTVLRRMYAAADKVAAGDYDLKLGLVAQELTDLRGRLQLQWGPQGEGQPPNSVLGARTRR